MSDKSALLTKIGYRATERTVRIGSLFDLHQRSEERDIVKETRLRRVFSLADAARSALRFLLWLVGLPLPALQMAWSAIQGLLRR